MAEANKKKMSWVKEAPAAKPKAKPKTVKFRSLSFGEQFKRSGGRPSLIIGGNIMNPDVSFNGTSEKESTREKFHKEK